MSINQKKTDLDDLNQDNTRIIAFDTFFDLYKEAIFDKIGLSSIKDIQRTSVRHDEKKKMEAWDLIKKNDEGSVMIIKNQLNKGDGINTGVRYGIYDNQTLLATFYMPEKTGAKTEIKIESKKNKESIIYEIQPIAIVVTMLGTKRRVQKLV